MDRLVPQKHLTVVKIGGSVLENPDTLNEFLESFHKREGYKVLVHGGGPQANRVGRQLGVEPAMHHGRRITDRATLDVVTMVYAGLNAKQLVSRLQQLGCNALSLSGPDGNLLTGVKRPVGDVDFGFVGDVDAGGVNVALLRLLLENNYVPVLNSITHNGDGVLLNTNADTIAATVAVALAQDCYVELVLILDHPGVLADPSDSSSVIPELRSDEVEEMKREGTIAGGMMPKITNAIAALTQGVATVRVGDCTALRNLDAGTQIFL